MPEISKIQYALDKAALSAESPESVKAKSPQQFCELCAKCLLAERTENCAKNIAKGVRQVLQLALTEVDVTQAILDRDSRAFREAEALAYTTKLQAKLDYYNPKLHSNSKREEVSKEIRDKAKANIAAVVADNGVARAAKQKVNCQKYLTQVTAQKEMVIEDYERWEVDEAARLKEEEDRLKEEEDRLEDAKL